MHKEQDASAHKGSLGHAAIISVHAENQIDIKAPSL